MRHDPRTPARLRLVLVADTRQRKCRASLFYTYIRKTHQLCLYNVSFDCMTWRAWRAGGLGAAEDALGFLVTDDRMAAWLRWQSAPSKTEPADVDTVSSVVCGVRGLA